MNCSFEFSILIQVFPRVIHLAKTCNYDLVTNELRSFIVSAPAVAILRLFFAPNSFFCSCLRFKRTDLSSTRSCTFNQFASDPILIFFPGSCFWRSRQLLEAAKTLNRNMNWELSLLRSERETRKFEKGF